MDLLTAQPELFDAAVLELPVTFFIWEDAGPPRPKAA